MIKKNLFCVMSLVFYSVMGLASSNERPMHRGYYCSSEELKIYQQAEKAVLGGKFDTAISLLKDFSHRDSIRTEILADVADALCLLGKYEEAIKVLKITNSVHRHITVKKVAQKVCHAINSTLEEQFGAKKYKRYESRSSYGGDHSRSETQSYRYFGVSCEKTSIKSDIFSSDPQFVPSHNPHTCCCDNCVR